MSDRDSSTGSERTGDDAQSGEEKLEEGGELRTIAFRLREIQRLLGARIAQENRRMAAEGLDPVTEGEFYRPEDADEE